jgi:ATP-binding cassette subfamily B protein
MAQRSGDRLLVAVARLDLVRLSLVVLSSLTMIVAGLLLPDALAGAVDTAVTGHYSWPRTLWLLVLGAALVGADAVGGLLSVSVTSAATAWLRRRLATHLLRLGTRSGFADGDAVSRLISDCVNAGAIATLAVQLGGTVLMSTGAVVLLAALDPWLAVVFMASVPLAVLLARSHLRHTADDTLRYQQVSGELGARLLDAVAGLRTITASGIAEAEAQRVLRPLPGLGIAGRGIWRTQARMVWRAGMLLPAVELAVLVAAGYGLMGGRLSVGDVLASLGYVALGMTLVSQIPTLTTLSRARSCAARITEVLDTPAPARGTQAVGAVRGNLDLRGVRVDGALDDVELSIEAGTFVAVVGRSGAGKSVLVGVLGGLITPDAGLALLDGVPLQKLRPDELRAAVAYAFERPALIGASVADAVGYGTAADDAMVREACRAAQVHDLLVRLPDGYRTPLSQTPLSGGEAQRVGLARALVRRPRVLILDDATASLDTVTEAEVERAISTRCTRVVVTHRAATADRADLVVWLGDGRVRAVAPHAVLWHEPGYRGVFTESEDASWRRDRGASSPLDTERGS